MNGHGESDALVVPRKSSNKDGPPSAEGMEGRGAPEGSLHHQNKLRAQNRASVQNAMERIRQAAKRDRKLRFTSLYHLVYHLDSLRAAFFNLKRDAAPGLDGVTWRHYLDNLDSNLQDLSERLCREAYQARPVRRRYIPKSDGRLRPLGITVLEDKIVQRATVEVMNAIYETDFRDHSYGCRPGRKPHDALDAVYVVLYKRKANWVLDADIRAYFDNIDHQWLLRFLQHRIADRRLLRLITKWLKAGVMEDGELHELKGGTPQGGVISPLLANIYLHYVLDLWTQAWRHEFARGEMYIVRYVDDCAPRRALKGGNPCSDYAA
jgi:group II intron reverse transcriptase/maturase